MLLAQIEGFLEIAEQGNLSRAAATLMVTQPGLTARIRGLEDELGTPLFIRGRRGMELTDAGRAFRPYAERAMAALGEGTAYLRELGRGGTGELVLGAAPAVSTYVLPGVLLRFTERYPGVRLTVRTGHSEEIVEMAIRREIDLGLVRELHHPEIESDVLFEDELVLVAHASHSFAKRDRVDIDELSRTRLIMFDRTSSYYELTNALFRQAGVAPNGVMELDNIDAAKQMVGHGLGVALLPFSSVAEELGDGRLRAVAIADAVPIRRSIVVIRRRGLGDVSGPAAAFLEVLAGVREILPDPWRMRIDETPDLSIGG